MIFTFPANQRGEHEKGASYTAFMHHGAVWKQARGRAGNSYAIPCFDFAGQPLPHNARRFHIYTFLQYATEHPDEQFTLPEEWVTLGVADLFDPAPTNVHLPLEWNVPADGATT